MLNYLSVSVTFLDPVAAFHGRGDADEPEWPPSPLRLFQALVAAGASPWRDAQFHDATQEMLEWLQRQHAPIIVAPAHRVGMPARIAVPNNDLDIVASSWARGVEPKKQPNELKTLKTVRPTWLLVSKDQAPTVHYLFPLADSMCPHLVVLTTAARSITHLGWGVDMVAANVSVISDDEATKLQGENWRPVEDNAAVGLRVPVDGTLRALVFNHQQFLNRIERDAKGKESLKPVPPLSTFRVVGYRRSTDVPGRPWVGFKLLHPVEERLAWFSATRANGVAGMTRHATGCAASHRPQEWVESYVHGHRSNGDDSKPRFSYLPLPTIEPRGQGGLVVGGIRRVILAEFTEAPTSYLSWAKQMLPGQFLVDEQSKDRRAMLAPLNEGDWVLRQYTDEADTWATVTPVVLPGCDARARKRSGGRSGSSGGRLGNFAKAKTLFFKALRHAGYSPEALAGDPEFSNESFWPGGDLALRFQRPHYLQNNSVYHVRLRWKHPVSGPIAIGAGRHCGLGIFAAIGGP